MARLGAAGVRVGRRGLPAEGAAEERPSRWAWPEACAQSPSKAGVEVAPVIMREQGTGPGEVVGGQRRQPRTLSQGAWMPLLRRGWRIGDLEGRSGVKGEELALGIISIVLLSPVGIYQMIGPHRSDRGDPTFIQHPSRASGLHYRLSG